jgi:hypothetical protein
MVMMKKTTIIFNDMCGKEGKFYKKKRISKKDNKKTN